ncbi:hypothetical protein PAXRUDRAFT_44254, partial [Paxillus rubicundulus Ve08.2h10]
DAVESLASMSASFLVDGTPLTSSHHLPQFMPSPVTPTRHKHMHSLLNEEPANEKECTYQAALHESYAREFMSKSALVGMQSTAVLQSMFCDRLSGQLAAQEEKRKKKKKGQLNGDGLLRLLTGDEFYNRVVAHQEACEELKMAQEDCCKQKEEQSAILTEWRKAEKEQKKRNAMCRQAY